MVRGDKVRVIFFKLKEYILLTISYHLHFLKFRACYIAGQWG